MLYSAVLLGLVSSLHCVGMCGPIALMLPLERNNPAKKVLQLLTYHAGRISTYAMLGILFGLFGRGLFLAGFQQKLSIAMGIIIISLAILPEKYWTGALGRGMWNKLVFRIRQSVGDRIRKKGFASIYLLGVFNGMLPCALVYMALFGAVAMQQPVSGAAYMALFGLGTIPLMSIVAYLQNVIAPIARGKLRRLIPVAAVIVGSLFVLRGLGLGIPYISPQSTQLFVMAMPDCK